MNRRRLTTLAATPVTGGAASMVDIESLLFASWLATLALLSWHDLRTRRIPTAIVNPATAVGAAALAGTAWRIGTPARFGVAAATAAAAYVAFAALHAVNPGGLGYGDVRLSGLMGLFLGWLEPGAMLVGTLLGAATAAAVAVALMIRRRCTRSTLPFGPFLAAGAATVSVLHGAGPLG